MCEISNPNSAIADDIGRHNTLDKLRGHVLVHSPGSNPSLRFTTDRISSEMLQKAGRIGGSVLVSLTSPNLFTIQLADEWGMTRIDYARPERFIIYTHAERIIESAYLQYSFGWFRENSASLIK